MTDVENVAKEVQLDVSLLFVNLKKLMYYTLCK